MRICTPNLVNCIVSPLRGQVLLAYMLRTRANPLMVCSVAQWLVIRFNVGRNIDLQLTLALHRERIEQFSEVCLPDSDSSEVVRDRNGCHAHGQSTVCQEAKQVRRVRPSYA